MDGWRKTVDVSDDLTTYVVDVADETLYNTFDDKVFVTGGRDGARTPDFGRQFV